MRKLMAVGMVMACACAKAQGVSVTQVPAGAACPAGGVQISVAGQAPQLVCGGTNGANGKSGSNGAQALIKQTRLPVGDENCPAGGTRLDDGLDNGAGGGVAGDGILEPGEVTQTSYICRGSSGAVVGSLTPPPGDAGTARVSTRGGDSAAGPGGDAGPISLDVKAGTNGGHLELFRTGQPELAVALPPLPAVDLGPVPALIAQDTTVSLSGSNTPGAAAAAGTLFVVSGGDGHLWIASGSDAPAQAATGLSVAAGVTLTVPDNGSLAFDREVVNAGTIVVPEIAPGSAGNLYLFCESYYGAAGSALRARGPEGSGVNGGSIGIYAYGALWNGGDVDVSGASGPTGGYGGYVDLSSNGAALVNTGALHASGGDATTGAGGSGGSAYLYAGTLLENSGAVDARGGQGVSGIKGSLAGGSGGTIGVGAFETVGSAHNSGPLDASGGAVASACDTAADCNGGPGGSVQVFSYDGEIITTGGIRARGGASAGGVGGKGGSIEINDITGDGTNADVRHELFPVGNFLVSGDLDASGASGPLGGGRGGSVNVQLDPGPTAEGQELILYGYAALDAHGGSGQSGGLGGAISLEQHSGAQAGVAIPGGAVVNYADLDSSGGSGSAGPGGRAGDLLLATQHTAFFSDAPWEILMNAGALTASGGSGGGGGQTGLVTLLGRHGLVNLGAILARGGNGGSGAGGAVSFANPSNAKSGYSVELASFDGPAANSGSIDNCGGAGGTGGLAGVIFLQGATALTNSGALSSCGGAGVSAGGDGGLVRLLTLDGFTQNTAPAPSGITVAGGAAAPGGTNGMYGEVEQDGILVTSAWTH